jgi:hypothetical protein
MTWVNDMIRCHFRTDRDRWVKGQAKCLYYLGSYTVEALGFHMYYILSDTQGGIYTNRVEWMVVTV